jgi:hypothetical protein
MKLLPRDSRVKQADGDGLDLQHGWNIKRDLVLLIVGYRMSSQAYALLTSDLESDFGFMFRLETGMHWGLSWTKQITSNAKIKSGWLEFGRHLVYTSSKPTHVGCRLQELIRRAEIFGRLRAVHEIPFPELVPIPKISMLQWGNPWYLLRAIYQ